MCTRSCIRDVNDAMLDATVDEVEYVGVLFRGDDGDTQAQVLLSNLRSICKDLQAIGVNLVTTGDKDTATKLGRMPKDCVSSRHP